MQWRAVLAGISCVLMVRTGMALPPTPVPRTPTRTAPPRTTSPAPTSTPRLHQPSPTWTIPPAPTAVVPAEALFRIRVEVSVDGGQAWQFLALYEGLTGPMECRIVAYSPCQVLLRQITPTPTPTRTATSAGSQN